jgi:hypothetical protein
LLELLQLPLTDRDSFFFLPLTAEHDPSSAVDVFKYHALGMNVDPEDETDDVCGSLLDLRMRETVLAAGGTQSFHLSAGETFSMTRSRLAIRQSRPFDAVRK